MASDGFATLHADGVGNRVGKLHQPVFGEHLHESLGARIEALAEDAAQQVRQALDRVRRGRLRAFQEF